MASSPNRGRSCGGCLRCRRNAAGLSAKKTAGWGVAEDGVLFGKLAVKGAVWPAEKAAAAARHQFIEPEESFRKFMDERGQPHAALKKPAGQWLSNQEFKTAG